MYCRYWYGILVSVVLNSANAASITEDLGELEYYRSYETGALQVGAFSDAYLFSVPRTAMELYVQVDTFGSRFIVDRFEIWREDSLVFERDDPLSIGSYFVEDPLQLVYTLDYISSISGQYRLSVYGTDPFGLGGFYNVTMHVNRNMYIPAVPAPSAAVLLFSGLIGLTGLKRKPPA